MKKTANKKGKPIRFCLTADSGKEVFVAGTFNNWDPRRHPMRENEADGIYQTTLILAPGRYEYKFVANGEWHVDPDCPEWVTNEHGTLNSVITV